MTRVTLSSRNQLWITFNRPVVTKIAFSEVLCSRTAYGTSIGSSHNHITVLPVLVSKPGVSSLGDCSVQCGRVLLTAAGLASILRAAGDTTSLLTPLHISYRPPVTAQVRGLRGLKKEENKNVNGFEKSDHFAHMLFERMHVFK